MNSLYSRNRTEPVHNMQPLHCHNTTAWLYSSTPTTTASTGINDSTCHVLRAVALFYRNKTTKNKTTKSRQTNKQTNQKQKTKKEKKREHQQRDMFLCASTRVCMVALGHSCKLYLNRPTKGADSDQHTPGPQHWRHDKDLYCPRSQSPSSHVTTSA